MSGNPIANAQGDNLLYGGEVDPRVNPIDLPINSIYIFAPASGSGALLRKQDSGVTTNFDTLVTDAMQRDFSNAQPAANAIDLGTNLINNLADPVAAQDAATKNYVDTQVGTAMQTDFSNAVAAANAIDMGGNNIDNIANLVPDAGSSRELGENFTTFANAHVDRVTLGLAVASPLITFSASGTSKGQLEVDKAYPSGATVDLSYSAGVFKSIGLLAAGVGATGSAAIHLETGDATTGPTGDMNFRIGSTSGAQGEFKFLKAGVAPNVGDVWTASAADGSGYWAAPPASGDAWSDPVDSTIAPSVANDGAFNLGVNGQEFGVAFIRQIQHLGDNVVGFDMNLGGEIQCNRSFRPAADATYDLGFSSGKRWRNVYASNGFQANGTTAGPITLLQLYNNSFDGMTCRVQDTSLTAGVVAAGIISSTGNGNQGMVLQSQQQFTTDPSGDVGVETGNTVDGNSGNIILQTGTPSGTGTRGNINLEGNKVDASTTDNALRLPVLAADPSSPVVGDVWYNTTSGELKTQTDAGTVVLAT